MVDWGVRSTSRLLESDLHELLSYQLGAVRIPAFVDTRACEGAVRAVLGTDRTTYESPEGPRSIVGTTLYSHLSVENGLSSYESDARAAIDHTESDLPFVSRLVDQLRELLGSAWPNGSVDLAQLSSGQPYFAGLVRVMRGGALLACDHAAWDSRAFEVGAIRGQLAANVYLQPASVGGELVVYQRSWIVADERLRLPDSYGYDRSVVRGANSVGVHPHTGDLVIFNPVNYHEILPTAGDQERVSLGCFVGLQGDDLILWS